MKDKARLRIVLVDTFYAPDFEELAKRELGEWANVRTINAKSGEELGQALRHADAVIVDGSTKITARVIEQMRNCRLIVTASIGYDNLDLRAARRKGIKVSNTSGYCVEEVADHALGLLIAITRKIVSLNNSTKMGNWENRRTVGPIFRLRGKKLGIIGLGRIGTAMALRAKGLGLEILAYDPYIPSGIERSIGVRLTDMNTLLRESDVISLHAPLTDETRHMISTMEFAKMKNGVFIINTARGAIVDSEALLASLRSGKVAGAALDVFEKEPPEADDPLLRSDQVIVTPHSAFLSVESKQDRQKMAIETVTRILRFEHEKKQAANRSRQSRGQGNVSCYVPVLPLLEEN